MFNNFVTHLPNCFNLSRARIAFAEKILNSEAWKKGFLDFKDFGSGKLSFTSQFAAKSLGITSDKFRNR
jgi:hypothetical protein